MRPLLKQIILLFCLLIVLPNFVHSQSQPYLSVPVNGSVWDSTTPTLYWWYVPNPYYAGPFDYSVQLGTHPTDFSPSNLLVDATIAGAGAATYTISSSAGLNIGTTYYWRVGVGGNYSSTWFFTPSSSTGGGPGPNPNTYVITASAGPNGFISPVGSVNVTEGNNQSFIITANTGFEVDEVLVDSISVGEQSSYEFTNVQTNHTIEASFIVEYDTTFVAMTGDDTNGDGSKANPYRTIQHGHNRTDYGGRVFVYNGNYDQDIVLTKPISIIGEFDPSTKSFIVRANDVTIKNFRVTMSSPGPGIQKVGFESYDYLEGLHIENVDIYNNAEQGILLENIDNVTIMNCSIINNQMAGIALWTCKNVVIDNVGLEDNLRGMWVHNSDDVSVSYLFAEDNGKNYPALYPDENGITFTNTENITFNVVNSNSNEEKGIKFEDCSFITLNQVSALQNKTDGIVFTNCTNVDFNGGFSSNNGLLPEDNGMEIVKCDYFELSDFAANSNFNMGIYLGTNYTGYYQYNPANPPLSWLIDEFMGQNSEINFESVSADNNGTYGMRIVHANFGTFTDLSMTNNAIAGLHIDASQHLEFIGGTFDYNGIAGILIYPFDHAHSPSHLISSDEITTLSFTGNVNVRNNLDTGILINTLLDVTKITNPLFYGTFLLSGNGGVNMVLQGNVESPIFSGFYFEHNNPGLPGIVISSFPGLIEPEYVKISNSVFDGYDAAHFAITLDVAGNPAINDVDARNNVFVGAVLQSDVDDQIWDELDLGSLGLVDVDGWSDGRPAIDIGSASAYTGAMVTIPIDLNIVSTPISFNQLYGELLFDETKLEYKYTTGGTGTIIHDADWAIVYDHSTSDMLKFMTFGFNAINSSGTLFYVTFEVVDGTDGSVIISGDPLDWLVDSTPDELFIKSGTINYTSSLSVSLIKGDATLDFDVTIGDYIAVINHVNGTPLTGQAYLNANVNGDAVVDELDAADILAFINNDGVWPNRAVGGSAELLFANSSVNSSGLLRFPITLTNAENLRTLQIELKYDEDKLDYRNFIQLLRTDMDYVEVKKISDGVAKLIYTSAEERSGTMVPAEIMFNIDGDPNSSTNISTSYSINGGEMKAGPSYGSDGVTGVEESFLQPDKFDITQNYPNPFNPSTTITYSVPEASFVTIKVYDILGRLVQTLLREDVNAGVYNVSWNGLNQSGSKAASGTYIYSISNGSNVITKKMLLLK